ncbi:helix-turn-helix domain-containing protein [Candidatus Tisiphia endosymbiont of Hybos culiciformis]|uniref:helix-turn-helix domain-containing protein n=1 Tax=Candidatus Tisiphia endosymbiont of Hybos culiciformis TaxID=3139331 RepID=UPI003CCB38DD
MALVYKIQEFLKKKFDELKLERKDLVQKTNISYPTICKIMNLSLPNPEIGTILKIANYFKCSMDEVVGRNEYVTQDKYEFIDISLSNITSNLRNFINNKLQEQNLNPYKLGRYIGFSENPIQGFVKKNSVQKKLRSEVAVALADYFQISLDEMIGRIDPADDDKLSSLRGGVSRRNDVDHIQLLKCTI